MASRYLHPLVCTKCGAALPAAEGQTVLTCPYCGQTHAFVPPPLEPGPGVSRASPNPKLATIIALAGVGLVVCASAAFILLRSVPSATVESAAAEPTAHGPGDPKALYSKGQDVDIHWGSSWWPGSVIEVDGTKYRAHYEGYGTGSDEWVLADRLRPRVAEDAAAESTDAATEPDAGDPNATYAVGDAVDIYWGSAWWPGSIKKKDGSRYRITYQGYAESWDEWVTAARLRPRTRR